MKTGFFIAVFIGLVAGQVTWGLWGHDYFFPESQPVEVQQGAIEDVPESLRPTTYTPPVNIYLPEMMFLVVDDTDSIPVKRCKNMAYRTVDKFSRQINSNLVRADKKLYYLAGIIKDQCMDVMIAQLKDEI